MFVLLERQESCFLSILKMEFVQSQQKRNKLIYNQFTFYNVGSSKLDPSISFYLCDSRATKCLCRVHVKGDQVIKVLNEHNHTASV